jgi:diguanylate cyclase (GGDEF)-like protein
MTALWRGGPRSALLLAGGLLLTALIALVDYASGPHLSCGSFYLLPVAACAWWGGFPHGILLALAGSVAWHRIDYLENPHIPAWAGAWNGVVRFGTLALVSSLISRLHAGILRERQLARTDPLTGAANARTFYESALEAVRAAHRDEQPLTLAYFDVDDFKQLNDRLGHLAGDQALLTIVGTAQAHLSGPALLARLGGDEFALLLPGVGPETAPPLLGRLQTLLVQTLAGRGWPVGLSVGAITFVRPAWNLPLMLQQVDALMYKAKKAGKGRLEHLVVQTDQARAPGDRRRGERRSTVRVPCICSVRVRAQGLEVRERPGALRDISEVGIGLRLEQPIEPGTLLVVEPLLPVAPTLLARVIRVAAEGDEWMHGCALSTCLSPDEIGGWLVSAAGFPDEPLPPAPPSAFFRGQESGGRSQSQESGVRSQGSAALSERGADGVSLPLPLTLTPDP